MSKIEWTGRTWNPVVGCSKISAGCKNCYAIRMANRLASIPAMKELYSPVVTKTKSGEANWTGVLSFNEAAHDKPFHIKKPTVWFVNSMSDLFHETMTFESVDAIYSTMAVCHWHTFQVLTKRAENMEGYYKWKAAGNGIQHKVWPLPNVWVGVSVENQEAADTRIPSLLRVPAAVRFLSCEPLLGQVDLTRIKGNAGSYYQVLKPITDCGDSNRPAIDWVIVGGESGAGARPMSQVWANEIRYTCIEAGVAFFFKQWGEYDKDGVKVGKKKAGRILAGMTWDDMPNVG